AGASCQVKWNGLMERKSNKLSGNAPAPAVGPGGSITDGPGNWLVTTPRLAPFAKNCTVKTGPSLSLTPARTRMSDDSAKTEPPGGLTILTSGGGGAVSAAKIRTTNKGSESSPAAQDGYVVIILFLVFALIAFLHC